MVPNSGINKAKKRGDTQIVFSLTKGDGKYIAYLQATLTVDGQGVVDQSSKIGLTVINTDSAEAVINHLVKNLPARGYPEFVEDVRPSIEFLWNKAS